jgi:hypothetical protein
VQWTLIADVKIFEKIDGKIKIIEYSDVDKRRIFYKSVERVSTIKSRLLCLGAKNRQKI